MAFLTCSRSLVLLIPRHLISNTQEQEGTSSGRSRAQAAYVYLHECVFVTTCMHLHVQSKVQPPIQFPLSSLVFFFFFFFFFGFWFLCFCVFVLFCFVLFCFVCCCCLSKHLLFPHFVLFCFFDAKARGILLF